MTRAHASLLPRMPLVLLALAGCGNDMPQMMDNPMPQQLGVVSHTLTPFTLQPGEEKIYCQYVPPDGKDHWVNKFVTDMAPGSHHLVVFRIQDNVGLPASGPTPCTQLDIPSGFDGMLPGSQTQHNEIDLPDGVAMKMDPNHGLLFQEHYINATNAPLTSAVTWSAHEADPASVKNAAGMIFYSIFDLNIPTGESTQTKTCGAPGNVSLVTATGHMHKHGVTFDAHVNGQAVYHSDTWNEPPNITLPSPGMAVHAGDPISWSCSYQNDTGMPLHFGNSAATNEMCIFVSIFYPSAYGSTEFNCKTPASM